MANEFLITDVVDAQAIQQLKNLTIELEKAKQGYVDLANSIAAGTASPVRNMDELSAKAKAYDEAMKQLAEAQRTINNLQKQYTTVLDNVNKKVREAVAEEKRKKEEKQKLKLTTQEAIELSRQEVHSIAEAELANKRLRMAVRELTDEEDKNGKIRAQLNSAINVNTSYIRRNRDAMIQQKMTIGDYKEQIKAAMIELQNGTNTMKNFGIVAQGFGGIMRRSVSVGLGSVGTVMKGFVGGNLAMRAIDGVMNTIKSATQTIMAFEAANSELSAVLGISSKEMKELETDARRLGAATKYTASEATQLQIELAKLGFTKSEILLSTESILKFAQATGSSLPDAAALAGASLRMFNANAAETDRYVSAMAVATARTALSFGQLQTAMPIVGPIAKAFNFSIEDTLTLLGKLSDAGFDASMAATATRNIILNLADSNGKLAKAIGKPVKSLPDLVEGFQLLQRQGIDLATSLELTDKRSVAAFNTFLRSADSIMPLREQISASSSELSDMADTMNNNVQGALAGLSSAWEALMLTFYNSKGTMKDVIDFLTRVVSGARTLLMDYSEQQEEYNNTWTRRAQKDMAKSDIVATHEKKMRQLYKNYLNEGMSADEAAAAAKEEYLARLQRTLDAENNAYQEAVMKRKDEEAKLRDINMGWNAYNPNVGAAASAWFKFYKERQKQIEKVETAMSAAAGKKALAAVTEATMAQLESVNLTSMDWKTGEQTQTLTEEQLKALEKAKKERLKLERQLQEAVIDSMEEGLKKEIEQISLNYNKRMAEIKGNSETEQKLREQLAANMSADIEAAKAKYAEKEEQARLKAIQDAVNKELKIIQQSYAQRNIVTSYAMQEEQKNLLEKYKQGEITLEEYEKRKEDLAEEYAIEEAKDALEMIEKQLDVEELSAEQRMALMQKLHDAKLALAEEELEAEERKAKKEEENRKKSLQLMKETFDEMENMANEMVPGLGTIFDGLNDIFEKVMAKQKITASDILQSVATLAQGVNEFMSNIYQQKIDKLEEEEEANEEAGDKEIERIERLAETGAITQEEAEARKRAAEDKTAAKNEEIAKKKAALQTKQAKLEKATNIVTTIMNTAVAIMKALSQGGIFAAPMVALISAMGAIQLATIIAQPIPKYAKGTSGHRGGMAIVGDGGKQEAVITDSGVWATPDVPTLVNLPKGAVVLPDLKAITSPRGMHSDLLPLSEMTKKMQGDGVTVNVNNDYTRLESRMEANASELRQIKKLLRTQGRAQEMAAIYGRV